MHVMTQYINDKMAHSKLAGNQKLHNYKCCCTYMYILSK